MDEKNVILLNSIKVDKYVRSFFETFNSSGYTPQVAKKIEKAMFDYFNKYLPQKQTKKFKLEKYGITLVDYETGKIFDEISLFEKKEIAQNCNFNSDSLLAFERSQVNFI